MVTEAGLDARTLVLDALRDPTRLAGLPPRELDLSIRLLRRGRVLGRIAHRLREAGVLESLPRPVPDRLNSAPVAAQARERVSRWELNRIAWAIDDPGLRPVVLKGCAYLLAGTPNAAGRSFADVDLLVEAVREVPGTRYRVLAPIDMVLHAATHLFNGGEMDDALRELVDIGDLLAHFGQHEPGFWREFWPRAKRLGLARPAFYALRYAQRWLGARVPADVVGASRIAAPPAPVLVLMDRLVPLALFPPHPDFPSRRIALARFALFVRSHWVRMPPLMLARHLGRKFRTRYLKRPVAAA